MRVYKYNSYDHYVEEQTKGNKEKLNWVYVKETSIKRIKSYKDAASNIICHGTRNGAEQAFFKKYYHEAYVIGTEISDTASSFPMTVEWDFANQKDEWVGKFDIVYSNAFDHSFDPIKTLNTWKDQLSDNGVLVIEYSQRQSIMSAMDPVEATNEEFIDMLSKTGMKVTNRWPGKAHGHEIFAIEKA